ncbi:MAG: hypothetical protein OXE42_12025 [Gammaproteobacteria bacterium]|nr:hypothetical protein [Gammaproteobacteria bacterium]
MSREKDLKSQNTVPLTAIYVGTLTLMVLVQWGVLEAFAFTDQLFKQSFVMAAITSFGALLSHILPNSVKHALLFLRISNVLPGHRCKTLCANDQRLSMVLLQEKWPELFVHDMAEVSQNAYWYKEIFSPVKDTREVLQAHRSFLLYRDAVSGLFVLLTAMLLWQYLAVYVSLSSLGHWSLLVLISVILLCSQASRQSAYRMVTNAAAVGIAAKKI